MPDFQRVVITDAVTGQQYIRWQWGGENYVADWLLF